MQITFTNDSGGDLYVSRFYKTMATGTSVTTTMTAASFDAEQGLRALVETGALTATFVSAEDGDAAMLLGMSAGPAYSDGTRPLATAVPPFTSIWNTSDGAPNWSDGAQWVEADGTPT